MRSTLGRSVACVGILLAGCGASASKDDTGSATEPSLTVEVDGLSFDLPATVLTDNWSDGASYTAFGIPLETCGTAESLTRATQKTDGPFTMMTFVCRQDGSWRGTFSTWNGMLGYYLEGDGICRVDPTWLVAEGISASGKALRAMRCTSRVGDFNDCELIDPGSVAGAFQALDCRTGPPAG